MQRNKHGIPILPRHQKLPFDAAVWGAKHRQCTGKVKHRNRASALQHRDLAGADYGAYYCRWCSHWHIGHWAETLVTSFQVKP